MGSPVVAGVGHFKQVFRNLAHAAFFGPIQSIDTICLSDLIVARNRKAGEIELTSPTRHGARNAPLFRISQPLPAL
jgi:hypothetical protein